MEVHLLVAIACPTLILGSLNRAEVTSQLRQGLFTNYDETTQPPSTDSDGVTQVDFGLTGFWLDLDNVGILRGSMWIKLKWNDERLSWTTNNGPDTLDHLHVDPSQIWSPDISLFNRFDSGAPMFPDKVKGFPGFGIVSANGDVNVVPTVAIQAICEEANLADLWAEQNCTLRYGSWTYSGYKLDIGLHYEKDQVDLSQYAKSSPLEIKATVFERKEKIYDCCPEPYVSMEVTLTVQRRFVLTPNGLFRNPFLPVSEEP